MAERIKRIIFTGNDEEDIKLMFACKEFVSDLKAINRRRISKPKSI